MQSRARKFQIAQKVLIVTLIIFVAVFIDQITKLIAFHYVPDYYSLIPGWLGISHVENDAIAFGIGSGNRPFMILVMILTAVLMVGIPAVIFTVFKKNTPAQVTLAIIEGGAIGNFIDRLFVKNAAGVAVVRDFVDLTRFGFANCNVADFCITLGAVALLFIILFIGPSAVFPLKKSWRDETKDQPHPDYSAYKEERPKPKPLSSGHSVRREESPDTQSAFPRHSDGGTTEESPDTQSEDEHADE